MKRTSGARKTANLSESIHRQLSMYVLAAGSAGVGVLTLGQLSEAKIIYTAAHEVIGPKHQYNLDLNHDKVTDFSIQNAYVCGQDWCGDHLSAIPVAGNGVAGPTGFRLPYASALRAGELIGQKQPFPGQLMASYSGASYFGRWFGATNRYLGLKFKIKGKIHFGWARLSVLGRQRITATLTGYAYETIPGKSIIAGATKGPDDGEPTASFTTPTPEPATLGTLAMGSPGLSIWRRKESADAANLITISVRSLNEPSSRHAKKIDLRFGVHPGAGGSSKDALDRCIAGRDLKQDQYI
jgi:hypothetical protein